MENGFLPRGDGVANNMAEAVQVAAEDGHLDSSNSQHRLAEPQSRLVF